MRRGRATYADALAANPPPPPPPTPTPPNIIPFLLLLLPCIIGRESPPISAAPRSYTWLLPRIVNWNGTYKISFLSFTLSLMLVSLCGVRARLARTWWHRTRPGTSWPFYTLCQYRHLKPYRPLFQPELATMFLSIQVAANSFSSS